jgi:hypothetical protein
MKTNQIFNRDESRVGSVNRRTDQSTVNVVRRLGQSVLNPNSQVQMPQANHSGLYVPFSENNGFTLSESKSVIECAPGTTFNRKITIKGTVILSNCFIDCFENVEGIVVQDGGRLILRSCHISKGDNKQTAASDAFIRVNSGGYLSVSDCVFHGNQNNTGKIVINDDAANTGRVAVLGSMNLTDIASPYLNVGYTQDVP